VRANRRLAASVQGEAAFVGRQRGVGLLLRLKHVAFEHMADAEFGHAIL
jgi:hypothetical protein